MLLRSAKENCAWLRTLAEIEQEALELHAARIFDNPAWDGYIDFNKQYRPNAPKTANSDEESAEFERLQAAEQNLCK